MPWRSRLIASTRSSRSLPRFACWASTSRSSSSARRLTAPSRSRSRLKRSRSASTSAMSGGSPASRSSASAASAARLDLKDARRSQSRGRRAAVLRRAGVPPPAPTLRGPPTAPPARRARRDRLRPIESRPRPSGRLRRAASLRPLPRLLSSARALGLELRRRVGEQFVLGRCFGQPGLDRSDLGRGPVVTREPIGALGCDRGKSARSAVPPRAPAPGLPRVPLRAGRGRRPPWPAPLPVEASRSADGGNASRACLAASMRCLRLGNRRLRAAPAPRRGRTGARRAGSSSRSAAAWRSRAASASRWSSRQRMRAAFSASRAAFDLGFALRRRRRRRRSSLGAHVCELGLDVGKPVAAGEAARRRGRRVRGDGETVPAPQVAFRRHQPLAGLQLRDSRAPSARGDDADLRAAVAPARRARR